MASNGGLVRRRIIRPMVEFVRTQASGGVVLLVCALVALVCANSSLSEPYSQIWESPLGSLSLKEWINDGLMAVFFLLVGLEIKREFIIGELSSVKSAALPIVAAVGGMIVPALVFVAFNEGKPSANGWAIPMATDIAFSLGVLAVLGTRAPLGVKVFLAALAIVDDLGAVTVIALVFSEQIDIALLAAVGGALLFLMALNWLKIRSLAPYILIGIFMWLAMKFSGVHATVAGVLLAMTIPVGIRKREATPLDEPRVSIESFENEGGMFSTLIEEAPNTKKATAIPLEEIEPPLQRLEHALNVPVNYLIVPLFALANAGIVLRGTTTDALIEPVTTGVALGLFFGKAIGISLFSWLSVKVGIAVLPTNVNWRHVVGVAFLGGIGFTMSLFISGLAFGESQLDAAAKLGILIGSVASGLVGWLILVKAVESTSGSVEESA